MSEWRDKQARWESYRDHRPELSPHTRALWKLDQERTLAQARAILAQTPGRVIDVGTGATDYGRGLADHATAYLALDPTPSRGVEQAERRWMAAGLGEALPLRDSCAHLVMLRASLDHMEDDLGALREACRVLVPGGRVLVTLSNRQALLKHLRMIRSLLRRRPVYRHLDQHLRHYSLEDLRQVARTAGLELVAHESYPYLPRGSPISYVDRLAPWMISALEAAFDLLFTRGDVFLAVLAPRRR